MCVTQLQRKLNKGTLFLENSYLDFSMKTYYNAIVIFDGITYIVQIIIERANNELAISFGSVKRATIFGDPLPDPKLN